MEPRRLVSCEIADEPVEALTTFIERHGLGSAVRPFYGVDQSDRERLTGILDAEFGDDLLDLVIDDASHLYEPTLASFAVLFPRLRPGGVFIIEDWAADYAYATAIEETLSDPSSREAIELEQRMSDALIERPGGPTPLPQIGVELLHLAPAPTTSHDR